MRLLSLIGILCSLAAILASMAMNYAFMFDQGKTVLEGQIYGWLSVAFDGFKAILPILIAGAFAAGKYLKGIVGGFIFVALVGFALLSAIGFAAGNRGAITQGREAVTSQYNVASESLQLARSQLAAIKTKRSSEAILANMGAMEQERRWRATKNCTDATAKASIEFCKKYFLMKAEKAEAKKAEKLKVEITGLKQKITDLENKGAGAAADPQAGVIARLLPKDFKVKDVQDGLVLFIAFLVEMVAAFGLYLSTGFQSKGQKNEKTSKQNKTGRKPAKPRVKARPDETLQSENIKEATDKSKTNKPTEPELTVIRGSKPALPDQPERFSIEQGRALIASK